MPDLFGKTVVVTGANGGLGYEAAAAFAAKNAHVVLACRKLDKAQEAAESIRARAEGADLEVMALDLADLASVRGFADEFLGKHRQLDVLCNNAGVMAVPLQRTADGFEMQIGTNHFGHFALTGLLFARLAATPGARVVTVSSNAHRFGHIDFDDPHARGRYRPWTAYGQAKLANLLFAYELQRRLADKRLDALSIACHPGYAATNLALVGPQMRDAKAYAVAASWANRRIAQSAAMGALPTLFAATSGEVRGGDYIGPDGRLQLRGYPRKVGSSRRSRDEDAARRLWALSEEVTGVRYTELA